MSDEQVNGKELDDEEQVDVTTVTQDQLDDMNKYERREMAEKAEEHWESMDETEREKLREAIGDACIEYAGAIDEAITEAGQTLAVDMQKLRAKYGTLIVDAAIDDYKTNTDVDPTEDAGGSIADVEEAYAYALPTAS